MDATLIAADAVAWRRHLHRHPELSFHEHDTARFVRATLARFDGLELSQPTATSVLARLHTGREGPTFVLRADIDALPVRESSGLEFASEVDGVMHACGHDGHTAMLLGAARLLATRRAELAGEVRFVFQHAEELPPGGAAEVLAAGAVNGADAIVGCHLMASLEVGKVAVGAGPAMAAGDTFSVLIRGHGGHAAIPHETVDPIAVAAQAIANLQHIVSRASPPLDGVVVSVTWITGGTADNIIPEAVEFGGTVRTFTLEARERTRVALSRILDGVAAAHGASCELTYAAGYAPVVNDARLAGLVREVAGSRAVTLEPVMAADDFSAYQSACPSCYFFVGAGGPEAQPHHHPGFVIDERALPIGIEMLAETARRFLDEAHCFRAG